MSAYRTGIFKRVLLSIWALATLVLLFSLALLINELFKAGEDPLAMLQPRQTADERKPVQRPSSVLLGSREITLYFATEDGQGLGSERRRIDITASAVDNCRSALRELIAGPSRLHFPVLAPSTKVRALYLLENGELVIDFSGDLQPDNAAMRGAGIEALMAYAVVNTLTQPELRGEEKTGVKTVRFLIEGSPPQESFPAHIDLSEPAGPDPQWILADVTAPGNA